MVKLYFKHLYPSFMDWREEPFTPWKFDNHCLLSVLSFFESKLLDDNIDIREDIGCEIMMDSGAFAATAMGFNLDPYEVAEMQAILKADIIVPLDIVVLEGDPLDVIKYKVEQTIRNTEILLDFKPKGSEILGPLQGFTKETIQYSYDVFRELGVKKFALGGIVFQPDLEKNLERIKITQEITSNYFLHVFGKFLHPELLNEIANLNVDSVDGYGYVVSSVKGLYIKDQKYEPISELSQSDLDECACSFCRNNSYQDFSRGDREAQHLLISHNISALNGISSQLINGKEV